MLFRSLVTFDIHDVTRATLVDQDALHLALPNLDGYYQGIVVQMLDHLQVGFSKRHYWSLVLLGPRSFLPYLVHMLQVPHLLGLPSYFIFIDL